MSDYTIDVDELNKMREFETSRTDIWFNRFRNDYANM